MRVPDSVARAVASFACLILQRFLIGLPYFVFRFFGLDMWGWAIGFIAFTAFVTFGFLAFCFFNCCGSVRVVQSIFRRRRDAMPFMDMVSNRFSLSSFNALLFLYPFCILSTFVIGGSLLIEPSRSFANAGALATESTGFSLCRTEFRCGRR